MKRSMSDLCRKIVDLARQHGRFNPEAYLFVFQALQFAQEELPTVAGKQDGGEHPCGELPPGGEAPREDVAEAAKGAVPGGEEPDRHITGQQLCEAVRRLALRDFGYLAKTVLNSWGISRTGDIGDMVYHLIDCQLMKKTDTDRREDFDDVYEFDAGLCSNFRIALTELDGE